MQASAEANPLDLQAMQSMDWLFKKERIYLLAQFWQQRATLAEKEVTALKEQLAAAGDGATKTEGLQLPQHLHGDQSHDHNNPRRTPNANFEQELQAKDKEISQLGEEVTRLQQSIQRLQETSAQATARLEEEVELRRQHISRLEARLERQRDYDDLKREISVLKSVDLSQIPTGEPGKSLEHLILEKTKALQQTEILKPSSTPDTLGGLASPLQRAATASPHCGNALSSASQQPHQPPSTVPARSTPTPSSATSSSSVLFHPPLQNVETFGSFLGEEIVANWRRSLERSIMSQQHPQVTQNQPQLLHGPSLNHLASPTDSTNTPVNSNTPLGSGLDALEKAPTPILGHETPAPPRPSSTVGLTSPPSHQPSSVEPPLPPPLPSSMNGAPPKSPVEESCHNNNNNSHHLTNNNIGGGLSVLDTLKSPFRFDDHRAHFRFADELGAAGMAGRLGESLIPKGDPMEARLQEMLRYNMDKYASQNLDTLHIARRVRELLSIHNIGQRLFAKYVLGLSQGTVSELLSKPKPWDKLTEKGRDSYRKMHGWACDDNAVMLLKSLIPKKGKEQGIPTFARGPQDGGPQDMSDERLAHILSESGHLQMRNDHDMSNDADSKSPHRGNCPSPFGRDRLDSQNRRLKKYENDDIPQEKVMRIYQEELAKLMGRRVEDLRGPRDFPPSSAQGHPGMDRTQEEIRLALDAYQRDLQKLNVGPGQNPALAGLPGLPGLPGLLALQQQAMQQHHLAANGGGVQDLSLGKSDPRNKMMNGVTDEDKEKLEEVMRHAGSAFSLVRPKQEPPAGPQSTPGGSSASSPLGNSILPPAMTPNEEFAGAAAASPLQRMASITNSLISQPSTPTHHSPNQRPLKAVLPPITQQQFDMYNNLNTEDIVKRVKEQLSQYSISQRLFGESVLGLSQGSVSDLLARPKPWHMLTQKGREPFIRMKMFLEDDNAVHKLVASQYKIAPEKLMRTGGYGGLPPCGTPMKPMPPTKLVQEQLQNAAKAQAAAHAAAHAAAQHQQESQMQLGPPQQSPQHPQNPQPPPPMMLTPPGPHHTHVQLSMQDLQKKQQQMSLHSPHHQMTSSPLRGLHPHISPSVYEMAALTQDLDTQTITTKIKEALLANNIGQKIFGEAVLGLSQGSVSELLSKPKPWHMLSIKGREPFIRMQLWLSDAHNVDRLQALKNERREANKRRRSSGPGHDNSSDTSSNDTAEFYHAASPGPGPASAKKQRVLFSEEQKEALRLAFTLDPYPNPATIEYLAGELALSSRTITNWFHNHRMRLKQQSPHASQEPQSPREPGQSFDPVQFRLLLNQRLLEIQKERLGLGNVPIPYPPYFNTNLVALVGNALKEQCSGLDLSMGSLKREPNQEFDDEDDGMSNLGSEDSDGSAGSMKREPTETPAPATVRSNRRKPAAPQWVNPEWQEPTRAEDEVIINGVCVMQTDDYGVKRETEETVRVEPTPVQDRYEEDAGSDASSVSGTGPGQDRDSPMPSPKSGQQSLVTSPRPPSVQAMQPQTGEDNGKDVVKHEPDEAWDY